MSQEILAYNIAKEAFKDKTDKSGKPYFNHIQRVSEKFTGTPKICALLHDLLEDCPEWTEGALRNLFGDTIANIVVILTKNDGEDYFDYIDRISKHSVATEIKLSDLKDNMDITRLDHLSDKDVERLKKYHKAYKILQQ